MWMGIPEWLEGREVNREEGGSDQHQEDFTGL
jgi:hypothetical protein